MKFLLLILLLYSGTVSHAQKYVGKSLQSGVELDVLPYATGGYFAAGWVGKNVWRVRALTAFVKKPDWATKKGFNNHKIYAYALVADRFLKTNWKGWWAGAGLVYWNSTIQTDQELQTVQFNNLLANGSVGYNISLHKHFYVSPWASLNLRIAGDKNVLVDNRIFTLPFINPEASLKFGYYF